MMLALVLDLFDLIILGGRGVLRSDAASVDVAGAFGIDGEQGNELFQLCAFARGTRRLRRVLQDEGFEALTAIQAFVVVDRHRFLF